ncbi:hypothetical protein ACFWDZ_08265 [Micromonospora aurantiaca]|uniref:hypothetical protein n=1 Tax=Micromonospora aurantiaca (nom. illeg.) TaxID=47850 RepID=UPI0013C329BA|nr:hypothetical protein [Micromonospora aurantiaca]
MRWEDTGEEEEVSSDSRTAFASRGSLRHQWLIDPGSLPDLFAADPKGLVLRLLRETGVPMTAKRVKEELVAFGLDEKKIASAWAAARKLFATSGVKEDGKGAARTYAWTGRVAEPTQTGGTAPAGADRRACEAEPAKTTVTTEPSLSKRETPEGGTSANAPADEPEVERVETFAQAVARALGDEPARGIDHYAKKPLQTGTRLGRLGESAVSGLVASLPNEERHQALGLFLALPIRVEVLDGPGREAPLDPATVHAVLVAAVAEIRRDTDPSPASRLAVGWLMRRASAAARPSASAALIALMAYAAEGPERDSEALDLAAQALSRHLPLLPSEARQAIDFGALAAAVAHLPLQPRGGRVALLAAVAKARPEGIADEAWWSGVKLSALVACAAGGLGSVTSLPVISERVLRPLVMKEISAVNSRTRLAWILGLPREFAAQLPADAVAAAFRRVAKEDRLVTEWAEAITDDAGVDALRNELKQALDDAAAASQHAEVSEDRARELAERCDRLEEILRREHNQAVVMRASQERQVRIDVVRTLADLAAEVEELAANQTAPELLVERVRSLVAAQALEPIGVAGTETSFDPSLHKPVFGSPDLGAKVSVLRPGYRWRSSGEDIRMHKALVTTA